ncbi:hypothetical protein BACCELL_02407 [Bacteroides cellulosilyticus DSM 14838]|uniref:Uncharacterized protein n=1 Tax=Bacteroides cellulosilyticus DSM 14838 TaxID=537012 RepID=E2NDP6_9BACE|nr:hypothetical protein BACCELL_02407 [Bacteroides cellulosilyticus DSM 14838]
MNSINHCISLQQREQNLLIPFATFHIENNSQIVSTCKYRNSTTDTYMCSCQNDI